MRRVSVSIAYRVGGCNRVCYAYCACPGASGGQSHNPSELVPLQFMHLAKTNELEATLDALAIKMYLNGTPVFTPLYPHVLVRVLSREQVLASGIVLPKHQQNKVNHEGVVLATWKPFTRHYTGPGGESRTTEMVSELAPGDHVLFQHFAGMPIPGLSDVYYRVVRELEWTPDTTGGIFAKVEHPRIVPIAALLAAYLEENYATRVPVMVRELLDCFEIQERRENSSTLSGV